MRGLSAASVEAFDRRGMLHPLLTAVGRPRCPGADRRRRTSRHLPGSVGHFAGMMLDPAKVDVAALQFRLPSPAMEGMLTDLEAVEAVLAARASQLGVEIRRGAWSQPSRQDDEITVAHAGEHAYPARWLVGCDGGRSTVRRLAGFEFVGTEPEFTGYSVQADHRRSREAPPRASIHADRHVRRSGSPGVHRHGWTSTAARSIARSRRLANTCKRSCAACPAPT